VTDTVGGYRVRERARSLDARLPWVLLAELVVGRSGFAGGYVVWFEDECRRRSQGYYTGRLADARAEFERRAGFPTEGRGGPVRPRVARAARRPHELRQSGAPRRRPLHPAHAD
jgi:hypothetical protein